MGTVKTIALIIVWVIVIVILLRVGFWIYDKIYERTDAGKREKEKRLERDYKTRQKDKNRLLDLISSPFRIFEKKTDTINRTIDKMADSTTKFANENSDKIIDKIGEVSEKGLEQAPGIVEKVVQT